MWIDLLVFNYWHIHVKESNLHKLSMIANENNL